MVKLPTHDAYTVYKRFAAKFAYIPEIMRKTLTYDRGKEMAEHERLSTKVGIQIYFADPHSPWQRASNENTNGLLRQYLPKGAELADATQAKLERIAQSTNARPRKTLAFLTPSEAFGKLLGHSVALGT